MASMKQVALIRGINVGRAKRVAMADLRELCVDLGLRGVETVLNSGNVVFTGGGSTGKNAARIEQGLRERTGVTARVLVLTARELGTVVAENPLAKTADDPSRLFVAVLFDPASAAKVLPLTQQSWAPDAIGVGSAAVYTWCPNGMLKSAVAEKVGQLLGDGATTRNWATLTKIRALCEGAA